MCVWGGEIGEYQNQFNQVEPATTNYARPLAEDGLDWFQKAQLIGCTVTVWPWNLALVNMLVGLCMRWILISKGQSQKLPVYERRGRGGT